jgi:hypothetical protein
LLFENLEWRWTAGHLTHASKLELPADADWLSLVLRALYSGITKRNCALAGVHLTASKRVLGWRLIAGA